MSIARFGTFTFDMETKELRRNGTVVSLQAQPAQVLAALLGAPNSLISREALRHAVWGDGTFVDFDRGLNYCVAQIRAALDDSAESPRFIRTVPKKGYQFIALVQHVDNRPVAAAEVLPSLSITGSRRKTLVMALGLAAVFAGAALGWWRYRHVPPIKIAVVKFDNETDNPQLDQFAQTLTDTLVGELTTQGQRSVAIIGNAAILRGPRAGRDLTEIARSLDVSYIILGQIQSLPPKTKIFCHVIHMPEQTHVKVFAQVTTLENPLEVQSEVGPRIAKSFLQAIRAASPLPASR